MARKKRFGDRNDGYRLRTLDPFYNFIPFIMARRSDAWTLFEDAVEITDTRMASVKLWPITRSRRFFESTEIQ